MEDNNKAEPIEQRIEALKRTGKEIDASILAQLTPLIVEMVHRILKEEGNDDESARPPVLSKGNGFGE